MRLGTSCTIAVLSLLPIAVPLASQSPRDTAVVLASPGAAARIAAERNAGVSMARLRADQAEARIGEERSHLLPSLDVRLSDGRRTFNTAAFGLEFPAAPGEPPLFDPDGQVEGPVRNVDLRGRLDIPVLDLAAMAKVRAARAEHAASSTAVDQSADAAALFGAERYVQAVRAGALVRARQADSSLAAELLVIARERLAAGVGVGLEVTRAESRLATARTQLISARTDRDRLRLVLLRALALPLDTRLVLPDSLAPMPNEQHAVSLGRRADLRTAALAVDAAERDAAAIRAERLPSVSLFGTDGQTGLDYGRWLNTYDYGVMVSMPLFDGFRRSHRLAEQRAVVEELELRRRDLSERAELELRSAELAQAAAAERLESALTALRLAELEVSQARERLDVGAGESIDVIEAALGLNQARTGVIDALAAEHMAVVEIAAATGTISELP
ncbi:MAG TPA: TolC family protein [Gemmatimonadales bacterium]|nr:TolC family protein [Gemmatimonadales bacterium]